MEDRHQMRLWLKDKKKMIVVTVNPKLKGEEEKCFIMQSTGVKDANGDLIYEGDIVRIRFGNSETGECSAKYGKISYSKMKGWMWKDIRFFDLLLNTMEVKGNIFDKYSKGKSLKDNDAFYEVDHFTAGVGYDDDGY